MLLFKEFDKELAINATQNGAIAAFISGGITLLIVLISILTDASGTLGYWNNPLYLVDVVLIVLLGVGLLAKSRACAVAILIYFIVSKIIIFIEIGRPTGLLVGLVFLYYYISAVKGAFVYHKLSLPEEKKSNPLLKWVLIIFLSLFSILVLLGAISLILIPTVEVQSGAELKEEYRAILTEQKIIFPNEKVEYFYSYGLTSILEGGTVLTDTDIIMYYTSDEGELLNYFIPLSEVTKVELIQKGNAISDSYYKIIGKTDEEWMEITLSPERNGDEKFIQALKSKINM